MIDPLLFTDIFFSPGFILGTHPQFQAGSIPSTPHQFQVGSILGTRHWFLSQVSVSVSPVTHAHIYSCQTIIQNEK